MFPFLSNSPERNLPAVTAIFTNAGEFPEVREKLSNILAQLPSPAIFTMFEKALKGAPPALQTGITTILAGSGEAIGCLLRALKAGNVKPDVYDHA